MLFLQQNGEIFAWWMKDFYISEKGHLLVDDWVYDSDYYLTGIYDSDLDLRRAVRAYIAWNDDERIFIEDGVKGVWNKVILHIDGDYGNWQESNLKPVDVDSSTLRWLCSDRVRAWSNCNCYNSYANPCTNCR